MSEAKLVKIQSKAGTVYEVKKDQAEQLKAKNGFKDYVEPPKPEDVGDELEALKIENEQLRAKINDLETALAEANKPKLNANDTIDLINKVTTLEGLKEFEGDERQIVQKAVDKKKKELEGA